MRTLRHAAEQLSAANTPAGRLAIATALGFDPVALPVDDESARRLGLPREVADAEIVRGRGALRALLVSAPTEPSLRSLLTRLAATLTSRTSHVLWLVIGAAANGEEVGVACWQQSARGPRVVALVARRTSVIASDAETLCALAATCEGDDLLVHTRWCDLLGREALSRRFYRILEQRVRALAESLSGINLTDRADSIAFSSSACARWRNRSAASTRRIAPNSRCCTCRGWSFCPFSNRRAG